MKLAPGPPANVRPPVTVSAAGRSDPSARDDSLGIAGKQLYSSTWS